MATKLLSVYKIRKHSRGLVIAIPRKYAKEHGIEAGREVEVYNEGDVLILVPRVAAKDE